MNIFEMVSGVGNSFSKSYEAAKKDALTGELGEKIRTGDYTGAADVALRGGDLKTGLELVKLGETRGASKQLGETLGGLFGAGGGEPAPAASGDFWSNLSRSYRQGEALPTFAQGSDIGRYAGAISGIESGGRYDAIGPTHQKYGRALGKYQVMESNLPSWSQEAIGRRVSPDEFLGTPAIQDAIFEKKFGQSVEKYGNPQDAASVWFTGRPLAKGANARDSLGTTGRKYVDMFTAGLGRAPAGQAPALPVTAMRMPSEEGSAVAFAPTLALPDLPPPQRSSVAVANNEADVQALEREMGMLPGAPRQVASAEPDAANIPAPGAMNAGFQIPEGQSQGVAPTAAAPTAPVLPPAIQTAGALAQARLPSGTAGPILRAAPGSPQRVQALIRASLIPGLSEQQLSTVRTLLSSEIEQSKLTPDQRDYAFAQAQGYQGGFIDFKRGDEGAKISSQVAAREKELRARGLDPNAPANQRYLFTGSMPEDRSRSQVVEARDGQRYVVNPDDPSADPRRLNIPSAGIRLWGSTGADGQLVQPPPNVPAGTAGYYDEKGEPQLIAGKGVNVTNNVGAGETEESKKLGGLRGERAAAIETAGMKAPDQIGKLNLLERALQGARTGTLGPAESTVVGFAQSLGIPNETIAGLGLNPDQAVTAQVATKLINESVVGMIGAGGFPANNFSNTDREFLTDIFPKMSNRPEANQLAIEVLRRVQKRNLEVSDAWAEYQQEQRAAGRPGSVAEFEFNFRKAQRGKPDLFADLRQQADAPGGGQGADGTGSGSPPPPFDPRKTTISMEDGKALTSAPDTAENRRLFDERYGAGASDFVLKRPLREGEGQPASAAQSKDTARRSSQQAMPQGYTSDRALFEARKAIAAGRDRSVIEGRLRAYGIDPANLDR